MSLKILPSEIRICRPDALCAQGGLAEPVVEALLVGEKPDFNMPDKRYIYVFCHQLC